MRKSEAAWIEKAGRWQINVQMDGTRRTFTSSTPGRKGKIEAERKADKWIENGISGESTKCGVLLDRYFSHVKASTSKANYRPIYFHIETHIRPIIGSMKIGRVTENTLQDVIDAAYNKGLAKRTLKNIKSTLLAFMKYCRREKVTTLHPEDLIIPNGARRSTKTVAEPEDLRILFASDLTTWRGSVRPDRYIHAYRLLVLTGLRLGELLGLRWQDVKKNKIVVKQAVNDEREVTQGKNENARRTIVLTGLALAEIDAQRVLLRQEGIISEYVFPALTARYTQQDTFRSYWNRYRDYNGIKKLTPYEMRHTFVSVNKEMPEGLKQLVVGHSRDMDTEGTYGHAMQGDLATAAEYSDAAFRKILAGTQ